jgi:hypothetical protein
VLLDTGGDGEDVRVEDDVFGGKADLLGQDVVGAGADLDLARLGVGLALSSKAMTTPRRRSAGTCWPADELRFAFLQEIELTMALPCTHFRPASMTSHLEESIITGTREMSGSAAIRFRNGAHRLDARPAGPRPC